MYIIHRSFGNGVLSKYTQAPTRKKEKNDTMSKMLEKRPGNYCKNTEDRISAYD